MLPENRDRYDGRVRNPFNEYECGHWYARALSSYALLQGLTGVRYGAVDKTPYIDSHVGNNFRSFLATATGFGTVGLDRGKPFLDVKHGHIDVDKVLVSGQPSALKKTNSSPTRCTPAPHPLRSAQRPITKVRN